VKAIDSEGNFGFYEQNITVRPYIEKGLLTNKTNEMIESGNYTIAIAIAGQIKNAPIDQIESNVNELEQVVSSILNYTLSVIDHIDGKNMSETLASQQLVVVEMLTTNEQIVNVQDKMNSLMISMNYSSDSIRCACNHTTSFSTFILEK
jgi:hypothetical protein